MTVSRLVLSLLTTSAAVAIASAAMADPPGRVGRVSYVEGDVSFTPPGETEWTDALRNFPVAPGESFWTGNRGRAELQVGALEARLDSQTELDVLSLDYGQTRLGLPQGSMDLRVWRVPRGGVLIATPIGDVRINQAGAHRIDVGAQTADGDYPPVQVTVLEGSAMTPGAQGLARVDAGESALIYAGYDPQYDDAQDAAIDDWARSREAREHWAQRASNDDDSFTGYDDLAAHGQFINDPGYGQVWYPRDVPRDWAPYHDGHWAYVQPWGWTWIDDQPWGFTPFHYGRWAQINNRWAWVRGQSDREPVYAPALVAFIGGGLNIGISVGGRGHSRGGGGIGWVPLAPDEVYRPSYRVSDTYVRRVNGASVRQAIINAATINDNRRMVNQYRNVRAATVVRSDAFTHGASVREATSPLPPQAFGAATVTTLIGNLAPDRAARTGGFKPGLASGGPRGPDGAPAYGGLERGPTRGSMAPPARLAGVRAAEAAEPADAGRPPVIPGARFGPPRGWPTGLGGFNFVAPSQIQNPAAQGRQNVAVPHAPLPPGPDGSQPPRFGRGRPALSGTMVSPTDGRSPPPLQDTPANDQAQEQAAERAQAQAHAQAQARMEAAKAKADADARGAAAAQANGQAQEQTQEQTQEQAGQAQARAQVKARMEAARAEAEAAKAKAEADAHAAAAAQASDQAQEHAAQAEARAQAQARSEAARAAADAAKAKAEADAHAAAAAQASDQAQEHAAQAEARAQAQARSEAARAEADAAKAKAEADARAAAAAQASDQAQQQAAQAQERALAEDRAKAEGDARAAAEQRNAEARQRAQGGGQTPPPPPAGVGPTAGQGGPPSADEIAAHVAKAEEARRRVEDAKKKAAEDQAGKPPS